MNGVAMLIHIPVVSGAKGNAKYNDAAWFDSMPGYRYMRLLLRYTKGANMGRTPIQPRPTT